MIIADSGVPETKKNIWSVFTLLTDQYISRCNWIQRLGSVLRQNENQWGYGQRNDMP